jgi:D-ribose pyranose/furanose isomerase RbsD
VRALENNLKQRRNKMKTKKIKKKLSINKLTIQNLDHNQVKVLESNEQEVVKAGSETNLAGITKHPIYCVP